LDVLVLRFGGGYAFYRLRTGDVGMVWGKKQPNGCGVYVGWILEVQRLRLTAINIVCCYYEAYPFAFMIFVSGKTAHLAGMMIVTMLFILARRWSGCEGYLLNYYLYTLHSTQDQFRKKVL
jgi:hypothetical protein